MSKASLESVGNGHFRVTGVLDAATTPLLLEESSERFPNGNGVDIHIDLGGVSESDSAGLALLLEWLRLAKGRSQVVHFANVPAQIAALARISEVEELILPEASNELKRA